MKSQLKMFHVKHQTAGYAIITAMNTPIKTYSLNGLKNLCAELGLPRFRSDQIASWLYLKSSKSYDDMTNLSKELRMTLRESHPLYGPEVIDKQISQDGTQKYLSRLYDGALIETVLIPTGLGKYSVCCSTQAGCPMACSFCATGKAGFTRNLSVGEIVDQVNLGREDAEFRISSVVFMGQGEPLLNYENTIEALHILNHPKLLNIGARHLTISTCGIIPGILNLAQEPEQFILAVSLHSARQELRNDLMPTLKNYPLVALKGALSTYIDQTNRRVSFEYALMRGVNDQKEDLEALLSFCQGLLCHVNLIPLNQTDYSRYQPSTPETMNYWADRINASGISATIRKSKGSDIDGACGQLANKAK